MLFLNKDTYKSVATTSINTEDHDLLARKFMIDFNLLEVSL